MDMEICFATRNAHKVSEVQALLGSDIRLLSLDDIGCREELPETGDTLEANARQKADFVWQKYGVPCFADDTGLEVAVLQGAPGVYSARFAGEGATDAANVALLLERMAAATDRSARFRTVIVLIWSDAYYYFEGAAPGEILTEGRGTGGFGYDPVFVPEGHTQTFAQMSQADKNAISHRGKAVAALVTFLHELPRPTAPPA